VKIPQKSDPDGFKLVAYSRHPLIQGNYWGNFDCNEVWSGTMSTRQDKKNVCQDTTYLLKYMFLVISLNCGTYFI